MQQTKNVQYVNNSEIHELIASKIPQGKADFSVKKNKNKQKKTKIQQVTGMWQNMLKKNF